MSREPTDIAAEARTLLDALAYSTDPAAFHTLLELSHYVGECLGISARTLAESQSWTSHTRSRIIHAKRFFLPQAAGAARRGAQPSVLHQNS